MANYWVIYLPGGKELEGVLWDGSFEETCAKLDAKGIRYSYEFES